MVFSVFGFLGISNNAQATNGNGISVKSGSRYSPQLRKKQKLSLDFTKKNSSDSEQSEMNQKIDEAERNLKAADNNYQRAQLNRIQKGSTGSAYFAKSQPRSVVVVDPSSSAINSNPNDLNLVSDESKSKKQSYLDTGSISTKSEVKEEKSSFGFSMIAAHSKEVEMPESGEFSNETTLILLPSYKLSDSYTAGLKFVGGINHSDSSKSELASGAANLVMAPMGMTDYITASPGLVYAFPVNSTQRDVKSFIGAVQGNVTFGTKNDALGKLSLNLVLGATKSFFDYSTELNTDPEKEDTYNSDYSFVEGIVAVYPLVGEKLSFNYSLVNKQAWDYANDRKYSYDMTSTLNWSINDHFTLFGGLENEEAATISKDQDLNYRFYNGTTSTYVFGMTVGL
jgi:hypothetical protein